MSMTRSERIVLKVITERGSVNSKELPKLTQLAHRTVNLATRKLLSKGLIRKVPNLLDMRTVIYVPVDSFSQVRLAVQTASAEVNI